MIFSDNEETVTDQTIMKTDIDDESGMETRARRRERESDYPFHELLQYRRQYRYSSLRWRNPQNGFAHYSHSVSFTLFSIKIFT